MWPARYRIVVRGRVSERLGWAFDGVRLEPVPGGTALVGDFVDASALYGLLDRLRDFGIDLESVNAEG